MVLSFRSALFVVGSGSVLAEQPRKFLSPVILPGGTPEFPLGPMTGPLDPFKDLPFKDLDLKGLEDQLEHAVPATMNMLLQPSIGKGDHVPEPDDKFEVSYDGVHGAVSDQFQETVLSSQDHIMHVFQAGQVDEDNLHKKLEAAVHTTVMKIIKHAATISVLSEFNGGNAATLKDTTLEKLLALKTDTTSVSAEIKDMVTKVVGEDMMSAKPATVEKPASQLSKADQEEIEKMEKAFDKKLEEISEEVVEKVLKDIYQYNLVPEKEAVKEEFSKWMAELKNHCASTTASHDLCHNKNSTPKKEDKNSTPNKEDKNSTPKK